MRTKTIYLTHQGAVLHKESQRLVVRKNQELLGRFPAFDIRRVLIFGAVQLTTQATHFLLKQGIDVSFHSLRGRFLGQLASGDSANVFLRLAQHDRCRDEAYRLLFSRAVVKAKMIQQRALMMRYRRNHPDSQLDQAICAIEENYLLALENTKDVQSVMGYEGIASKMYFGGFSRMVREPFVFEGRNRRPPKDPVNAILSFGYTLLLNEILSLIEGSGFDSFLGIMHGFRYGRQSLALDIIEEFRHSVVDRFALSLLNKQQFSPTDFRQTDEGGVLFKQEALQHFLKLWEERMRSYISQDDMTYREKFRQQIHELEEAIMHGRVYHPSQWEF